jgi:hypothetical protein
MVLDRKVFVLIVSENLFEKDLGTAPYFPYSRRAFAFSREAHGTHLDDVGSTSPSALHGAPSVPQRDAETRINVARIHTRRGCALASLPLPLLRSRPCSGSLSRVRSRTLSLCRSRALSLSLSLSCALSYFCTISLSRSLSVCRGALSALRALSLSLSLSLSLPTATPPTNLLSPSLPLPLARAPSYIQHLSTNEGGTRWPNRKSIPQRPQSWLLSSPPLAGGGGRRGRGRGRGRGGGRPSPSTATRTLGPRARGQ